MTDKQAPTVDSIRDGLTKLLQGVRLLTTEVKSLTEKVGAFKKRHPLPPKAALPFQKRIFRAAESATDEPRSAIQDAVYEFKNTDNLDNPTRVLLAIGKDLEGALLDIRAARSDINAIADDSDLRSAFRDWQEWKEEED